MTHDTEKLVRDSYEDTRRRFNAAMPWWMPEIGANGMAPWEKLTDMQKDLYRGLVEYVRQRLLQPNY